VTVGSGQPVVHVRLATAEDAVDIAELHVRGWQWAYRGLVPDGYLDALSYQIPKRVVWWHDMLSGTSGPKWTWVAEGADRIVGFADTCRSWDPDADRSTAILGAIYLERSVVRRGVGRALMDRAVSNLRDVGFTAVTLWVLDTNDRARRFYEALGWRPDGTTKTESRPGFELHELRYRIAL
jgi:GNAT superfamily N-acetyltransferase